MTARSEKFDIRYGRLATPPPLPSHLFQVLIAGTPTRRKNIIDLLVEFDIKEFPTEIYQSKPLKAIITLIIIIYYYISFINISHCDFSLYLGKASQL